MFCLLALKQFLWAWTCYADSTAQGVKYESPDATKSVVSQPYTGRQDCVLLFHSRKMQKPRTACHRPDASQLVLPSRDVLSVCAIHLPLWPPPPTSPRDQNLPSPAAATWSKETGPSVRLSVALALTALALIGIVRAAPLPHHWRCVTPASPVPVR